MKKVSMGQIMYELLCRDEMDTVDYDFRSYNDFGQAWCDIGYRTRQEIINGIKQYLTEQLGEDMVTE